MDVHRYCFKNRHVW